MGILIFNGVSTQDLGVVIQAPPVYEFPTKNYDIIKIEGKNGDVVIDKDSFNNVNREYNLAAVFRPNTSFVSNVREFVDWLSTVNGYARLEDSYEPDYFRLALFRAGGQMPNLYDQATGMTVKFECKPQRFLKTGEEGITFKRTTHAETEYQFIDNKTKYVALPKIEVKGGIVNIEVRNGEDVNNPVNTTIFTLIDGSLNDFIIDSELQDVYTKTEFINQKVSLSNGFPKLYPGYNWIKITYKTNDSEVILTPRWWVI